MHAKTDRELRTLKRAVDRAGVHSLRLATCRFQSRGLHTNLDTCRASIAVVAASVPADPLKSTPLVFLKESGLLNDSAQRRSSIAGKWRRNARLKRFSRPVATAK